MDEATQAAGLDHELIKRIETHCVDAWPAREIERWSDGWIMRATPGLPGRGRSNHALVPVRALHPSEHEGVISRVTDFSAKHGVQPGIQVGPLDLHLGLLAELQVRGWDIQQSVCVMTAACAPIAADADPGFDLTVTDHASDEWVAAWAACEPLRKDVAEHVATVFKYLSGRGRFFYSGAQAVGLLVESDGIVGLFCLAVNPDQRRQGLGKKLVRGMLTHSEPDSLVYLQVFSENWAGLALYNSLGFTEQYRYCHCVAPSR